MGPCHAGAHLSGPCNNRARARNTHRARGHTARSGRGRSGAVAGDRREGHGRASGSYPSGDGRPAAGDVAGASDERGRVRTEEGPERLAGERAGGGGGVEEGGDGEERQRGAAAAATGNFGSTSPR